LERKLKWMAEEGKGFAGFNKETSADLTGLQL
jgi:hypothetical protein